MANYLLFENPKAEPIMTVHSLNTALVLSWNCGYYILPQSDYRVGKELTPEPAPAIHQSIHCSNCHAAQGDKPMTANFGLHETTWLCDACMTELEQMD